jgi:hypothetical protein
VPSQLVGLFKTMQWRDYGNPRAGTRTPGSAAAYTHTTINPGVPQFAQAPGSSRFTLVDNFTVTAGFAQSQSFVMAWLLKESPAFQNGMLNHEQHHYDITGLVCRDFFIDVMLLKAKTFASEQDGKNAVNALKQGSVLKLPTIHKLYDTEVHPEHLQNNVTGPRQRAWDGYVSSAFSKARVPASQSPDGKAHKVRLIDVLRADGKPI